MTKAEYNVIKMKAQASLLREIAKEYPGRTIENIIMNIESRIKHHEENEQGKTQVD